MSHTCRLCRARRDDIARLELELATLRQLVSECESISAAPAPTWTPGPVIHGGDDVTYELSDERWGEQRG